MLGKPQFNFYVAASIKVHFQWDDGESFARDAADEFVDFSSMKEEFATSPCGIILDKSMRVRPNIAIEELDDAIVRRGV